MSVHVYDNFKKAVDVFADSLDVVFEDGATSDYKKAILWDDTAWTEATPTPKQPETPLATKTSGAPDATPVENLFAILGKDVLPLAALGFIATAVAIPLVLLRRRTYLVSFGQSGVGPHYDGPVFIVDGVFYDKYGASFWWMGKSKHSVEFLTLLNANSGKQYVLSSVGGLPFDRSDFIVRGNNTVVGYYNQVYRSAVFASRPNPYRKPFYTP
jgi:hypothetical protein